MIIGRMILVMSGVAVFVCPDCWGEKPKVTNWRVRISTEFKALSKIDTLIKPHVPSTAKAQELVDTLWGKVMEVLVEKVPSTFYSNPPYAGDILLTMVMKQKLSMNTVSSRDELRAAQVAHSILDKGKYPSGDNAEQRKKEVEAMRGKAKEYVFVGVRMTIKDAAGKEYHNSWYQAERSGKMKIKKLTPDLILAMQTIAMRSEMPVFDEHR